MFSGPEMFYNKDRFRFKHKPK